MQIHYRVYEEQFQSGFATVKPGIHLSQCRKFEIQLQSAAHGKFSEVISSKLLWKEPTRPEVGFALVKMEIPIAIPIEGRGFQVFQHGYQSWSVSRRRTSLDVDVSPRLKFLQYSQENIYSKHQGKMGVFLSEYFTILYSNEMGKGFLVGSKDRGNFGVKFEASLSPDGEIQKITAVFDIHCIPDLRTGAPNLGFSDIIVTSFAGSPEKALAAYFKELGETLGTPDLPKKVPTGWCSWYYYYTKISQKIILDNLAKVKEQKLPIEFFQIDDGYQREIGDWLIPNERFPGGMRILADEIKRVGLKPGIWLAPFLVRKKSDFYRKYPEAVLKDENGKPVSAIYQPIWGLGHTYALDVTHPAALAFLEKVFTTVVKEWGYPYLKLDFLYAGLLPGETYKKNLSPQLRYMEVLKMIRGIVGKNTFLLGCGAPMLPSIGFFDGMRVSCDVAPYWGPEKLRVFLKDRNALCTRTALLNNLTRASMHRNLWLNDPDCLLVRKKKNQMTPAQTQLMASVLALSGGMLLVSDDLTKLETERSDLLRRAIQLNSECQHKTPVPIGIFHSEFPKALYNPAGYLGVWNPEPEERELLIEMPVPIKANASLIDFWTGQSIPFQLANKGLELTLRLPAFGSYVFPI